HPDQWQFLSEHPCIEPATADSVAREGTRKGLVVGVRLSDTTDTDSSEPWTRRPSGQPRVRFSAPLPREVRAVIAQRLFVAKAGLAPTHLNQIKRLAAFQNPEFYKEQSLRLSTALTPRVVACAEELHEHVALPRGCRSELEQILREHGSALLVEDQRCEGKALDVAFEGRQGWRGLARTLLRSSPTILPESTRRRAANANVNAVSSCSCSRVSPPWVRRSAHGRGGTILLVLVVVLLVVGVIGPGG